MADAELPGDGAKAGFLRSDRDLGPLVDRLREMAAFLGLHEVQVDDRGDLAAALARAS